MASQAELENVVLSAVREVAGAQPVELRTSFDELGLGSIQVLRLTTLLEERFECNVDVVDVFTAELVGDLVALGGAAL